MRFMTYALFRLISDPKIGVVSHLQFKTES
jgi:hypothetical protein